MEALISFHFSLFTQPEGYGYMNFPLLLFSFPIFGFGMERIDHCFPNWSLGNRLNKFINLIPKLQFGNGNNRLLFPKQDFGKQSNVNDTA